MKITYSGINELENAPFKYAVVTGPMDWWAYSLSAEQIIENLITEGNGETEVLEDAIREFIDKVEYIRATVTETEEPPYTIRFVAIPNPDNCDLDLVGIAKIRNNGTCFVFSNNFKYLSLIEC